jgi:hypothetical protein
MAEENQEQKIIKPQEGFQQKFLSSAADIVIGGSAAGVGKTYALLMEFLRHSALKSWGGVIFRRTNPQIKLEGGLWDTSMQVYPNLGAVPRESSMEWLFPSGAKLKFSHLEYEKNVLDWQGAQVPFIGFDELTHFSEKMFFYLLSRNRSTSGVKPYVRATCNPDPESWVAQLVAWWIDQDTGYPIPERDGLVRYFIRYGETYLWGNSEKEVIEQAGEFLQTLVKKSGLKPEDFIKSLTFISGSIYQNQELLKVNPAYLANLLSQDEATRRSLLESNWKFSETDEDVFKFEPFLEMFNDSRRVRRGRNRIVADIALEGSNKLIISYFEGLSLEDIVIMEKSNGKQVLDAIVLMATKYSVPNSRILFDADGVGGYIDGFLPGAVSFHGNAQPLKIFDPLLNKNIVENYQNLKTQLIYKCGQSSNDSLLGISPRVAKMKYDKSSTIRERMIHERKAFKKDKINYDGKLKIIPKQEMKLILQGESPDIMDTVFMNMWFEIRVLAKEYGMSKEESMLLDY